MNFGLYITIYFIEFYTQVKEICKIARERNIISIIDGAHVPGHIELNIKDLDPKIVDINYYLFCF